MLVIDGSTILTEANRDRLIVGLIHTLTWEYDSFSCDRHLMKKSLIFERIYDSIERRKVHDLIIHEFFLEFSEGNARLFAEDFNKFSTSDSNARFSHREGNIRDKKYIGAISFDERCRSYKFFLTLQMFAREKCNNFVTIVYNEVCKS